MERGLIFDGQQRYSFGLFHETLRVGGLFCICRGLVLRRLGCNSQLCRRGSSVSRSSRRDRFLRTICFFSLWCLSCVRCFGCLDWSNVHATMEAMGRDVARSFCSQPVRGDRRTRTAHVFRVDDAGQRWDESGNVCVFSLGNGGGSGRLARTENLFCVALH